MDFGTLNLLYRFSREFSHEKIRMQDLSDTECMICSFIFSHENCSQDDVAAALKIDKTTVAKALGTLEEKKCVERTTDTSDKRRKRLTITEIGKAKISDLMDIHNNWLREVQKCLTLEEQKQFENYCERLLSAAEELASKQKDGGNI